LGGISLASASELRASRAVRLQSQTVDVAGEIVSGDGTDGGLVLITGDDITVQGSATITSTGKNSGGDILVGGSWQNEDTSIRQALSTTIEAGAVLDASATEIGDGGTIVAWSDITNPASITTVSGHLISRGGTLYGNGGRIETSGHVVETSAIKIDTSVVHGEGGLWLIDPYDITIAASGASGTAYSNTFTAGLTSVILASNIQTALNAGTSVSISTGAIGSAGSDAGNISVTAPIAKTAGATATLTLIAANKIDISANISNTSNTLNLVLDAGGGNGTVSGILSGAISLEKKGAGVITMTGVNTYSGVTTINGGTLAVTGTGKLYWDSTSAGFNRSLQINTGGTLEVSDWGWQGSLGHVWYEGISNVTIN
ncbi:MAG: autotransporter-associated beta strand repeat-containing protein, partial [Planctomycetia bacterium]